MMFLSFAGRRLARWTRMGFAEERRRPALKSRSAVGARRSDQTFSRTFAALDSSSPAAIRGAVAVEATAIQPAAMDATNSVAARPSMEFIGEIAIGRSAACVTR